MSFSRSLLLDSLEIKNSIISIYYRSSSYSLYFSRILSFLYSIRLGSVSPSRRIGGALITIYIISEIGLTSRKVGLIRDIYLRQRACLRNIGLQLLSNKGLISLKIRRIRNVCLGSPAQCFQVIFVCEIHLRG